MSVGSDTERDSAVIVDHVIYGTLLPVLTVELVPIGWIVPVLPSASIDSSTPTLASAAPCAPEIKRRLIKWSLPPPVEPVTPMPGWTPMP